MESQISVYREYISCFDGGNEFIFLLHLFVFKILVSVKAEYQLDVRCLFVEDLADMCKKLRHFFV